jgi:hypothetical protein
LPANFTFLASVALIAKICRRPSPFRLEPAFLVVVSLCVAFSRNYAREIFAKIFAKMSVAEMQIATFEHSHRAKLEQRFWRDWIAF